MPRPGPEDVTVTVVNWNGRAYLGACLDALRVQTVRPAAILLVDNASDDDSVAFVRAEYPEVEILEMARNEGPCPARNAGMERARTDWVLALDNDAILRPDTLETLLEGVEDGVAVVHPRSVFDAEPDRIHYDGARIHFAGIMTLRHFYAPLATATTEPADVDAAISVALLLDRRAVLEVGGYDPVHFILFEDHDLSYRLRAAGHRIRHLPAALVRHREGTAGISFREKGGYTARRVFLHSRNRWVTVLKNHRKRTLLLTAPGLLVYEVLYLGFAVKNRALGAWLRGKLAALGLLGHVLRERRRLAPLRRRPDRELLSSDPLTVSPLIERGGLAARLQRLGESAMRLWWSLVRPLC